MDWNRFADIFVLSIMVWLMYGAVFYVIMGYDAYAMTKATMALLNGCWLEFLRKHGLWSLWK